MPPHIPLIDLKASTAGLVPPAIQLRIVDAGGRDVPRGHPGELLLKGDNIFSGYWRAPDEAAQAFTGDGWFRTGDIARQDEGGYLFFVDRKKDMFISGGENVYPVEIEAAILDFLNARLARYKIPKYISFVEALPRTGTGKIQKLQLRARLQETS